MKPKLATRLTASVVEKAERAEIPFLNILDKCLTSFERVGWENCCIAEPSIVELLYGVEGIELENWVTR